MKPIGMDKNSVLVYEGDIVLYKGIEYKAYESELTGNLLLNPYIKGLNTRAVGMIEFAVPGAVEVVNVSDKTNYERYFADLCSYYEMHKYICKNVICNKCIADGYLCTYDLSLCDWLDESAVKL